MEIIIKTINTGINTQIRVDVIDSRSEFLPVLEKIVKAMEEFNAKENVLA